MLFGGILLLLLTGLCWVGIAVVVNDAAEHRRDLDRIQFCTSGILSLLAAVVLIFRPPSGGRWQDWILISLPVFVAGAMNFLMISLMKQGMRMGKPAAVWGIVQSALICPFLMGIWFFGVAATFSRVLGIVLIVIGILLFSRSKPQKKAAGKNWLIPTCGAFAASGLAQCFANLPSYWTSLSMSSFLRALLVQGGTMAAFGVFAACRQNKRKPASGSPPIWRSVFFLTAVQAFSLFFCFYHGLDLTARAGAGAIGYPVAQGSCIVFFAIYERIRFPGKFPFSAYAALLVQAAGLAAISL